MHEAPSRGLSLHTKILLGLVLGASLGIVVNLTRADIDAWFTASLGYEGSAVGWLLKNVMAPVGKVFLNMLLMTVIPLVFASLAVGVAQLGDLGKLGRMGLKTFAYFVGTMSLGVVIGLTLVNAVRPGAGMPQETVDALKAKYKTEAKPAEFGIDTFINIVPRNPVRSAADMDMLGVIFFALLVGAGLTRIPADKAQVVVTFLEAINELMVFIIGLAMRLAPYGVFSFLFQATANFGLDLLKPLGMYVVVVILGLAIQMFVVFPILVKVFSGLNPWYFFRKVRTVILTAFSTSSSNATLPTSIKVCEQDLGVPPQVAGFVLPLGATMNMNGTALFEGVTVLFLAQVFGVSLGLGEQLMVVALSVLTAVGAAGVPGGSIPLLIMVLATVGVPAEGIAIILGVDRLLDMCRTTLNVVGDITAATFVTRSEGLPFTPTASEDSLEATA